MKIAKYVKGPGYIYDLLYLFVLNFNKDKCLSNDVNHSSAAEEAEQYKKLYSDVQPISDDLLVFFHIKDDSSNSFLTSRLFDPSDSDFATSFGLLQLIDKFKDCLQITEQMIQFYFPEVAPDELRTYATSFEAVGKLIKKSSYSDTLKSHLYSFFLDPKQAFQTLAAELHEKNLFLSRKYEKGLDEILYLHSNFSLEEIAAKLNLCYNSEIDLNRCQNVYISFCMCAMNTIIFNFDQNEFTLLLGRNYKNALDELVIQKQQPDLAAFGTALSEPNRIDIMGLLNKKGEATIKEIEQMLGFSGTNTYYHLSLMMRAGMLRTRNHGRTIYYSLNKEFFVTASNAVLWYSK